MTIIQGVYNKKLEAVKEELRKREEEAEVLSERYYNYNEKIEVFNLPEKMLKIYSGNNIILCNADVLEVNQGGNLWISGKIVTYYPNYQIKKSFTSVMSLSVFLIDSIIPLKEEEMKDELFEVFMKD
jgi:hypothetical protein